MVALIPDILSRKLEDIFINSYWPIQMNVNPSEILPVQPNHTYGSTVSKLFCYSFISIETGFENKFLRVYFVIIRSSMA